MGKRPSTSGVGSKPVKAAKVDSTAKQCGVVYRALKDATSHKGLNSAADVPHHTLDMVHCILGSSVGVAKDERHAYQNSMVDKIEHLLLGIDKTMSERIATLSGQIAGFDAEGAKRDGAVATAAAAVTTKENVLQENKHALATVGRRYQSVKNAHLDASDEQRAGERELKVLQDNLANLENGVTMCLEPLKQGKLEEGADAEKEITSLVKRWKKLQMDESLMQASIAALSKKPEDRGGFDQMAVESLDKAVAELVSSLKAKIGGYDATTRKLETAVVSAKQTFEKAKAEQRTAVKAFLAAKDAKAEAEDTHADAEGAVRDLVNERKKTERVLETTTAKLAAFREGGWATFVELRDHVTPPPEEEEAAAPMEETQEEAAQEAPPVADGNENVAGDAA